MSRTHNQNRRSCFRSRIRSARKQWERMYVCMYVIFIRCDKRTSVMPNSHRPPDTTRQCCLCRVRRCELALSDSRQYTIRHDLPLGKHQPPKCDLSVKHLYCFTKYTNIAVIIIIIIIIIRYCKKKLNSLKHLVRTTVAESHN